MKLTTTIFILGLALIIACSSNKTLDLNNRYQACLPSNFKKDLNLVVESFNEFLNRNYDGQLESFISAISRWNLPEKSEFSTKDIELGQKLRLTEFKDFIYTEYEESYEDIALPKTVGSNQNESRTMIKVDADKPYLNCLSKVKTEGNLIAKYIDLQTSNPSLSPTVIGNLFLSNKSDKDYNSNLTKTIIAVEMYYMILNSVSKN